MTQYEREAQYYRQLTLFNSQPTPGIIDFYGSFIYRDTCNILLEYADAGTLEDFFQVEPVPCGGKEIIKLWEGLREIVRALEVLHEGLYHEQGRTEGLVSKSSKP